MTAANEPLTDLDARIDGLVRAIGRTPDLEGLIVGLEAYSLLLPHLDMDNPYAVDALSVAPVWSALAATAREVLRLREMKQHGRS